ncbi:MAG: GDP-mannose 4,6-dehydratase [Phycisphaeraceae bacterium]|nr:GDP-mannose 4,6-dehydratase [Phycisphaeraceae bacterium]
MITTQSESQTAPILVTGVAGLVGSHLAEALLAQGRAVVGIDNFNDYYSVQQKRDNVAGFQDHERFTLYENDVRESQEIDDIFAKHQPHAVAHLAAMANVRYSIGRAPLYTDVNINGSINLLEAATAHGSTNFVFASTSSAYGHTAALPFTEDDPSNAPLSAYPASKKAIELMGYTYHNLHRLNFTALRFFSVYGPRARPDMMPFMVTDRITRGETVTLFNAGQMQRDWTYVDDIVDGVVRAIDTPLGYEIINLGRGEPVLMADFVNILEEHLGKHATLDCPDAPASEPAITFANIDKARSLLGYDPKTSIQDGLANLVQWYQQSRRSGRVSNVQPKSAA